jgi:outer membrane protein assembly factor BamB
VIRIRTGEGWRHDPAFLSALRRGAGPARSAAARAVVDAVALEVDGVDVAAGLAEGPLLPTLEALLRAVARIVGGASHATVAFPEGEVEVLIRRRERFALLTVVVVSRPSRILARDVEVEVDALAEAALEASAALCRDLAELLPGAEGREARPLRAAARALRRTEQGAPPGAGVLSRVRPPRAAGRRAAVACVLALGDDDGLLQAYEGGRPDLGSLLGPGRITLCAAGGLELCALPGIPFLVLRDLGGAADAVLRAVRGGEARCQLALVRSRGGAPLSASLDLARGTLSVGATADLPCPPLDLARAFTEAQAELGRVARARNPRQAENAYVAELERAAAERLAQIDELAEGDRPAAAPVPARAPAPPRLPQRPLGPGRLRRLAFRPTFRVDAGPPASDGLLLAGGLVVVAGAAALAGVDRARGEVLWRGEGCTFAAAAAGGLLVVRGGALQALSARTGRLRWSRALPGAPPGAAVAFPRGPLVVVEPGAATGLDPGSGRTLWRFEPPGAARLGATAFGGVLAIGADTGIGYGLDAAGKVLWRLRAPGPVLRPPSAAGGLCLLLAVADPGTALLALEPATGRRRWEARLDVAPGAAVGAWGRRLAVAGALGGEPIVTVLERSGAPAWTVSPPLDAPVAAVGAGALLVVRAGSGALVALGRDGAPRWTRPAPAAREAARGPPPALARGTLISAAGDGIQALDAQRGDLAGAIATAAPVRLLADASLAIAALDAEGVASGWRLATHLSVV